MAVNCKFSSFSHTSKLQAPQHHIRSAHPSVGDPRARPSVSPKSPRRPAAAGAPSASPYLPARYNPDPGGRSVRMRRCLLCRTMPLPPPLPPSAPRTPGVAGGRLFASLPLPPPLQSRREVHVWYLLPDELNDASQLKMYMELLSPSERKNALSMNGEKLQKDTDCKVDPRSFEFKKNKFGKPEISWRPDDGRMEWPLHFNISHTTSLIACGITMDSPIGIDIEETKRKTAKSILSLARRYFTPSEVDYLAKISDPDAQQKEFIKLWTLKEAYVKALGRGFSGAPFNKFSIMLAASNGIQISVAQKIFKDSNSSCDCLSENWQFALAELDSSHYMAVCTEDDSRSSGSGNGRLPPLGLKVWKTIPFQEDTLVSGTEAVKLIS